MKLKLKYRILLSGLFFFSYHALNAQPGIITDNSFYTSFDAIHYSVYTGPEAPQFYAMELDDSGGKPWIKQKLKSDSGFFFGVINLSIHIPTGCYFLHAYPSVFSRKDGPGIYASLIIINAEDLEGNQWKKKLFALHDSLQVFPVLPATGNKEIPGMRSYLAVDAGYRIRTVSGKLINNSNHQILPVSSDDNGLIVLKNLDEPRPDYNMSVKARSGDTLSMKLSTNEEFYSPGNYVENISAIPSANSPVKLDISLDKSLYNPGDSVFLTISTGNRQDFTAGNARLTIEAKEQTGGFLFNGGNTYLLKSPGSGKQSEQQEVFRTGKPGHYFVHGKFINPSTGSPMAYHKLVMVSLGKNPAFEIASVDGNGNFAFDVSGLTENNTVYFSTIDEPSDGLSLDDKYFRDFDQKPLIFLDSENIAALDSFVSESRIRDVVYYNYAERKEGKAVVSEELLYDTTQVYDHADNSYDLNEYIQFGSIPEVIREILPYVNLKYSKDIPRITIYNSKNPDLNKNPLFLINGLPTHDVNLVISLNTHDVQKIDLLYERSSIQPFGLLGLGGVMAIYTAKPPDIPYSRLIDFRGLHHPSAEYASHGNEHAPDLSPVVYWDADAPVTGGKCAVKFRLNDLLSDILVNVTGYDSQGRIIKGTALIKVNKNI